LHFEGPLAVILPLVFIAEIMKVDPISIFTITLIIARNINEKGFANSSTLFYQNKGRPNSVKNLVWA
jgi:hypothetical protein